jgi:hypothetical protein
MTEARLDGVFDTTLSVGTGPITLAGAFSNKYRRFAGVVPDGSSCVIRIEHATSNIAEWEICDAVYSGGVLTRGAVQSSSNAGAAVVFSAGIKNVALVAVAARMIVQAARGHVPMPGPPAFPLYVVDGSNGPDYAMAASDYEVAVNKTVSGVSQITLPLNPVNGQIVIVSDAKGDLDVGVNNITVIGAAGATINGAASHIMQAAYQSTRYRAQSPTAWNIVA